MGFKLVRDNHRKIFEGTVSGAWRTSPDVLSALFRKLGEEYSEVCEDRNPAELYDVLDVLQELITRLDPDGCHGREHRRKQEIGGLFRDGLEWSPLPQGDISYPAFLTQQQA